MSADPDDATRYMLCVNAITGKIVWQKEYKSSPHHLHPRNSFASGTPAVDGFCIGAAGVARAFSGPAASGGGVMAGGPGSLA